MIYVSELCPCAVVVKSESFAKITFTGSNSLHTGKYYTQTDSHHVNDTKQLCGTKLLNVIKHS